MVFINFPLIIHFVIDQAQSLTPLYGVLISLASLIASGLIHFAIYIRREAAQELTIKVLTEDVKDLQADMRFVRDRIIAMRGKVNGNSYRTEES